jgi:response regulator of citrate/malate metabolism
MSTKTNRVFLVEDDPSCRALLRRLIHAVDPAATIHSEVTAEGAMKTIEKERSAGRSFDLVIADIFLSGKETGLDLWRACVDQCRGAPLVVTSSLPLHQYFDLIGRNDHAPIYLPKPYEIESCRSVLKDLLA